MTESSGFISRLSTLTKSRINESKYTKAFTFLVALTAVICIILEAIIVHSHVNVYNELRDDGLIIDVPTTSVDPENNLSAANEMALSLRRLKNENVFFILLCLFQLVLGIDAIVRQSVIQLMSHTLIQILAVVFAAIQVGGTIKKNNDVKTKFPAPEDPKVAWNFGLALRNEIGLVSIMTLFAFIFIYLCWKLYKQFGWNIYKRIGADINLQKRFRLAQLYLLNLKLDAFFQLVLCIFYAVVMTQEKYYNLWGTTNRKFVAYIIHIVLTVLLIPGLLLARYGVITENKKVMIVFMVTQFIMCLDFILVLADSAGSWVFWILAVCLAISLSISTFIFSILVSRNFGKGLKPFMQRLFESEEKKTTDKTYLKSGNEWLIDEEDEYPMANTT
ncbi:hypothetical protein EDC94DRAFT_604082 [Helicostylum pulchrum]|uniref:TRP C-terminal domain-containing protein n=1 Tax=Helicostylum pulchrum TaxID=562976 RepID=A0ABP9Y1T4_9FUNG|nr:hypothetical protein EDC94DRAFT_604082 [Helicostylum pulchrum]